MSYQHMYSKANLWVGGIHESIGIVPIKQFMTFFAQTPISLWVVYLGDCFQTVKELFLSNRMVSKKL